MEKLTALEIATLLLGLGLMLGIARLAGELFNYLRQPAIVGEILAGIILGPTILGALFPDLFGALFPSTGGVALAYHTVTTLAVVLLLMIAGLEIDLSILWRQGRAALLVSILGTLVPFLLGFSFAYAIPGFWGIEPGADPLTFALFFGTALSITALPVIAKIMMDLNLFKTDVGMLVMGAAMFSDLVGWIVFSIVLGMMSTRGTEAVADGHEGPGIAMTIGLTLLLVAFSLTLGRWLIHRTLPWIQSRLSWPGGILGFTLVITFISAAATEAIGIHAIFGAFLAGVAIGDSTHLRAQTRMIVHQFVTYIFAPIFFVAIGLEANFLESFNPILILGVLAVAFAGKLAGCLLGARLGRLSLNDSLAIAFGMNARGAMEIILGLLALQYGVIQEEMFVALVVLALLSSLLGGPLMRYFMPSRKEWRLADLLNASLFVPSMNAGSREEAIRELASVASTFIKVDEEPIVDIVLQREKMIGTGLGHEIAIPHARLDGLRSPVLVLGHSRRGIDFDSPDARPVRLVFLLLTPRQDPTAQIQIMGQIARLFQAESSRVTVYESTSIDIVRALVKTETTSLVLH